jgi:hypothetical protein
LAGAPAKDNTMPKAHHAYVNAAQILVCAPNVPAQLEKDVLQSALCAQLLADKTNSHSTTDWQHEYSKALLRMLWLRTSFTTAPLNLAGPSQSLTTLISQCLSDPSLKAMGRKVLRDLRSPLNAPALSVLHTSVSKTDREQQHPTGIYLEFVLLQSERSIHTLGLTLQGVHLPTTQNWLADRLVLTGHGVGARALFSSYQLPSTYRNLRASVQSKLGEWPERLTLAVLNTADVIDGLDDDDMTGGFEGTTIAPVAPVHQLPD